VDVDVRGAKRELGAVKVPFSWLREYCDPGLSAEEVASLLAMKAIEVERVTKVGVPSAAGFVVGRVLAAEKHPNADRLRVCTVDAGDGERTIVCGAPNVAAGQTVAVALPGATMPSGQSLGTAKLRGVESNGMILSERELELGDDHDGIMVLDEETPPGTALEELFAVADEVLELDLNPNRSDCLGVYGVAREVHAITGAPLAPAPWERDAEPSPGQTAQDVASVRVEARELCPRFTARAFEGVRVGPSPLWLRARLRWAGQRSISNAVDITNYVMLMTAQPLHAFDLDRVPGGEIIVRSARDGERMTTLDGVERAFDSETVLVCDRDGPTGIAGIMGGQVSEVSAETTRILLEVATWNGVNILRTSSVLGLRTDASARFEKQLHPELAMWGQRAASLLYAELCGARMLTGTIDELAELPAPHVVSLHGARLDSLLGTHVGLDEAAEHLEALEFGVAAGAAALEVRVPVHRHYDVSREADLVEEVGRLHGLDRLPRSLPAAGGRRGGLDREQALRRRAEDAMAGMGFDEIVSWHFVPETLARSLGIEPKSVRTANPLSAEHSALRTTLLGGLLDAARHNLARDADGVALFESGRVHLPDAAPAAGPVSAGVFAGRMPAPIRETHRIAALAVGPLSPASWRGGREPADFFDLKGVLDVLSESLGGGVALRPHELGFLNPGRSAAIEIAGANAGWLGELHPRIAARWDLQAGAGFELDLAALVAAATSGQEAYVDVTTHPALVQDLAVVVAEDVSADDVRRAVAAAAGELLRSAEVFDLYRGEQLGEAHKSLALRLEFLAPDRTLADAEVAPIREAIEKALAEIGGELRS
jgi:phenylalanyl-tRNA synthetase beta chain